MLEIFLIRHGQTVFNTVGRLQGWSDSPLTQAGREGAIQLGKQLAGIRFDAAFSSTAPRAVETAELILRNQGQPELIHHRLPDLREYSFGGFEGERTEELHRRLAEANGIHNAEEWKHFYRSADKPILAETVSRLDPLQLAETPQAFIARINRAKAEIVRLSDGLQRIIIVSHGMAITAILKSINPNCIDYASVPNVSVSRLSVDNGEWRVHHVGASRPEEWLP